MIKFAVPLANGQLCMHFGHCEEFAFIEADEKAKKVLKSETLVPPPHEPGVIPRWIASNQVNVAIVGGMGPMAQQILAQMGVQVIPGAPLDTPENLVLSYLNGTLVPGDNVCDHGHEGHGHEHGHNCKH